MNSLKAWSMLLDYNIMSLFSSWQSDSKLVISKLVSDTEEDLILVNTDGVDS